MSRLRRLSWGLLDQAAVSLSGAVVTVQGALGLPVAEFGRLATALAGYYLLLAVVRGVVSEVYVATFANAPGRRRIARVAGQAQIVTLHLSVGLALLLALASVALLGPGGGLALPLALAAAVPVLVQQDVRRAVLIAAGRTRRSALSSLTVLAGQLVAGVVLEATGRVSAPALVAGWALAALLGVLVARIRLRSTLGWSTTSDWLRDHRAYWPRFLSETLIHGGASQLPLLFIAALASTASVAGLRAATLLLSPVVVLHQAVGQLIVAEASRLPRSGLRRFSWSAQAAFLAACAGWVLLVLLLPAGLWDHVVGDNRSAGLAALPGMATFLVANLMITAPATTLRVTGEVHLSMLTRVRLAPLLVALPTAAVLAGADARVTAWAFGAFGLVALAVWNVVSRRVLRRVAPRRPAVPVARVA